MNCFARSKYFLYILQLLIHALKSVIVSCYLLCPAFHILLQSFVRTKVISDLFYNCQGMFYLVTVVYLYLFSGCSLLLHLFLHASLLWRLRLPAAHSVLGMGAGARVSSVSPRRSHLRIRQRQEGEMLEGPCNR